MINEQLELVSEFHTIFEQPILDRDNDIPVERRKLRLSLLFEELSELAEAYGLSRTFNIICSNHLDNMKGNNNYPNDTEILNKKEVLDATGDLQYILCGTILENGQQNEFDNAFVDIHGSNMSKVCTTKEEITDTVNKYEKENIEIYIKKLSGPYTAVCRKSDNKILKSAYYIPVNLDKYV